MSHPHSRFAAGLVAVVALLAIVALSVPTQAEEENATHIVYLNVTGVGPNALAWYQGSPPTGVPVQKALDTFSEQGYRVAEVRPYQRPVVTVVTPEQGIVQEASERDEFFIILLEK